MYHLVDEGSYSYYQLVEDLVQDQVLHHYTGLIDLQDQPERLQRMNDSPIRAKYIRAI